MKHNTTQQNIPFRHVMKRPSWETLFETLSFHWKFYFDPRKRQKTFQAGLKSAAPFRSVKAEIQPAALPSYLLRCSMVVDFRVVAESRAIFVHGRGGRADQFRGKAAFWKTKGETSHGLRQAQTRMEFRITHNMACLSTAWLCKPSSRIFQILADGCYTDPVNGGLVSKP